MKTKLQVGLILSDVPDRDGCAYQGGEVSISEIAAEALMKGLRFDLDTPLISKVKVTKKKVVDREDQMIFVDIDAQVTLSSAPDQLTDAQREELETDLITGWLIDTQLNQLNVTFVGDQGEVEIDD